MNKQKTVRIGIDVSKDTFNYHYMGKDGQCKNNLNGFRKFAKEIPANSVCSMESTGVYHIRLAAYLHGKGFQVMVLNPLLLKRWIQSTGSTVKTDKKDAKLICEYSRSKNVHFYIWKPLPPKLARAKAIISILTALSRFESMANNVNHAVELMTVSNDKNLLVAMENVGYTCSEQKESLQKELCEIVSEVFPDKFRLLQTITGIGRYTAAVMLVCAKGFEFESHRKLSKFVGVSPRVVESGTSVKGKSYIVKLGNPYLRSLLFMCAFSAVQHNEACKLFYERLLAKGKPKKLAHVAVMHKLIKISFGVVNSGEPFRSVKFA